MEPYELDEVDRELLTFLQENARYTAMELAEEIGVSDNTIHNRMDQLEEAGVITGYTTGVDHDRAGLSLLFLFTCTARISERGEMADEIMEFPSVLEVTELMTGHRNILVKALGAEDDDITQLATAIDDLDIEINDENLVRGVHTKPLDMTDVDVERMLATEE